MQLIAPQFAVADADIDERGIEADTPAHLAGLLAAAKAGAVFVQRPDCCVIGCDTVVDLDGHTLGKPLNTAEASSMLRSLAGRSHLVHTGVCVRAPGIDEAFVETTRVFFSLIPADELAAYIATGDPFDKAGGYGVQGSMARFIPRIEGCYYNVMGLPVAGLYALLRRLGFAGEGAVLK